MGTALAAAIQNVSVTEITATQAIIRYQAPDSSACTVEVSENTSYRPLVNDVDPVKFASAWSDSRQGSISTGNERSFVVGKRAAELGLEGTRYSRALQNETRHYFRITCPQSGSVAQGNFDTMAIPFGSSYAEAEPGDPLKPGTNAQPHISLNDRTEQVIDPQTGLAFKRLSSGNDNYEVVYGVPLIIARSSTWQNLGNLQAQDGQLTTASATSGPLFLGLSNTPPTAAPYTEYMDGQSTAYTDHGHVAYGYYQVHLIAAVNPGGTAPANPEDAKVIACLTMDGVNCYGGADRYEVALGTSLTDVPVGSMNSGDLWQKTPGSPLPSWTVQGARRGWAFCDGSPIVQFGGGDLFGTQWTTGSAIQINGANYTVASVQSTRTATLTSSCVSTNGQPVPYVASNFGVLLHKKTTSSDTIALDYGYVNYELNFYYNFSIGTAKLCGTTAVIGPNGRPGYNCALPNGFLYWIDMESGEAHLMGNLNTSPNAGCAAAGGQIFDANDPDTFYCGGFGPLYATKYYGNHSEPVTLNGTGRMKLFQGLNNCNTNWPNQPPYSDQQPCLVVRPATQGTDIPTLTEAFTQNPLYAPAFDKAKFRNGSLKDIDGAGNIIMQYWRGYSNSIGWIVAFNPNATSNAEGGTSSGPAGNKGCVGNGSPGCVVGAIPAWTRQGCRWCVVKGVESDFPGWAGSSTYSWTNSSPGTGPYYVQVIDGQANGTANILDGNSSLQTCPANAFGAFGINCTTVTVASEPQSPSHGDGETGLPGELGPAILGDRFATQAQFPSSPIEQSMLIKKDPGAMPGTWIYTLWRDINHVNPQHSYSTTGPNPQLFTVCAANQVPTNYTAGGVWYWNFGADPHGMNQTGLTIPPDYLSFNSHYFWGNENWVAYEEQTLDTRCTVGNCYAARLGASRPFLDVVTQRQNTAVMTLYPKFGQAGAADDSNLQSHVTGGGDTAPPERAPYFFDGRPYRGGFASGSVSYSGSNPAARISGQLYKFPKEAMPNIELPFRKIYPTAAFSGQYPLVDVSSPATGDVLGTGPADSYKYCVAAVSNECRAGAAAGDVYVNAPFVQFPYCFQADQAYNMSDEQDICIAGATLVRDAIMQIGLDRIDLDGSNQRLLTKFARPRTMSVFWTPSVLPNGKWMILEAQLTGDGGANKAMMLGKIPSPSKKDNKNRTNFEPVSFTLDGHANSRAVVRFGYAENGAGSNLFCTSRAESCVSVSQSNSFNSTNPFYFDRTEVQSYQPVECGTGCQITVPGIPQRVLYYQFVYRDSSGKETAGPVATTVVP